MADPAPAGTRQKPRPVDLTIIIVNWNGGRMLADCLASIDANRGGLQVQVIVVDNASRDGSREEAERRFPQFRIINSGANLGFALGNNQARPWVESDLVLFLNPDTVVLEDSLREMAEFMRRHGEVGALGCKMRSHEGEVHEQGLQYFPTPWTEFLNQVFLCTGTRRILRRHLPYLDPERDSYVMKLYGGCLLCRKPILDEVGWFDERYFMYAEDADLCRAIADCGWKLYYLASTEIIHVGGGTSEKAPSGFSILMKSESIAKLMRKHYGPVGMLSYRAATFTGSLVRLGVLCLLRPVASMTRLRPAEGFPVAFLKHRLLVLWALGLKRAVIGN